MPTLGGLLLLFRRRIETQAITKCRRLSTANEATLRPIPAGLSLNISNPTFMVWGSNTGVGKTLISTGIAASLLSCAQPSKFLYLKPVQTGFPQDSDSRFVSRRILEYFSENRPRNDIKISDNLVNVSAAAFNDLPRSGIRRVNINESHYVKGLHSQGNQSELTCKTLYGFHEAVSPHLAAEREGFIVEDSRLIEELRLCLEEREVQEEGSYWCVVEAAGGVASPAPSGTLQCDLYRPFRLPSILVVDGKLGGISGTIASYESLLLRGYDVKAVILADGGLLNGKYLSDYFINRLPVFILPKLPEEPGDNLMEWLRKSSAHFHEITETLQTMLEERMQRLHEMQKKAGILFWWPFTQHFLVPEQSVTVIDSRFGENFAVYKAENQKGLVTDNIVQHFDACASWWTQGPNGILQTELARDVGYAAGRFGHVMYPENVYEPVLSCAEKLLEGVGKGWANRVFFSDNGSTAIEIAIKMAFRKFAFDHGLLPSGLEFHDIIPQFKVLALRGSYHGDTLGAMEAQAPSAFTGFTQHPWYSGRGIFLDPPTTYFKNMEWRLNLPDGFSHLNPVVCKLDSFSPDAIFMRHDTILATAYQNYISKHLLQFSESSSNLHAAALILEPIIHAAGGMHMIDPLFQHVLVKECQKRRIPVIFDEVFTGFWRLGAESAADLLGCMPDIACYSKLLTGGTVPLAATLTSEAVFQSFKGYTKTSALLHGHSYSGHAIGCTAASKALEWFGDPQKNPNISSNGRRLRELWDRDLISRASSKSAVKRVTALGTVCAFELEVDDQDSGYGSISARSIVERLRQDGIYTRPLGNVIYTMCGPCTPPSTCSAILKKVVQRLEDF